ncbi:MAG: adhesin transport system outer membrane protein [Zhongshania aliphaticivorans]
MEIHVNTKLLIALVFISAALPSVAATPFTIDDAISAGLNRDNEVIAAGAELDAARTDIDIAKKGYLPSLQASVGSGDRLNNNGYEVRATQMLYDWGQVKQKVNGRKADASIQAQNLRLRRMAASIDIADVYLNLVTNTELVRYHQIYLSRLQKLNAIAQDRLSANYGDRIESDRTSIEIARTEQAIAFLDGELSVAQQDFAELTGYSHREVKLQNPKPLALAKLLQSSSKQFKNSIHDSPDYQKALAEKELAQSQLRLSKAERLPKLNLEASWMNREVGGQWQSDSSIGIQLRYDSAQGFSSWSKPKKARSRLRAAQYTAEAVKRDFHRAVRRLTVSEPATLARISALQRQTKHAKTVKQSYRQQFLAGTRDLEDLLSIEREIFDAHRQTVELRKELLSDQYQLAGQLGLLDSLKLYRNKRS